MDIREPLHYVYERYILELAKLRLSYSIHLSEGILERLL